jgi:biotin carboxyl carrier protein
MAGAPSEPVVVDAAADGALEERGSDRWSLRADGRHHSVRIRPISNGGAAGRGVRRLEVVLDGWRFEVEVEDDARASLRERATSERGALGGGGPLELRAIIPGRVVSVDVAVGDIVEAGGRLLVVEAMKMQNELRAARSGTVSRVSVGAGQTVERGDLLLVVE